MKRSYLSQFTNHLDQTSLENKEFIIWTLMNLPWLRDRFFLRGTARKTVQVRYGHPARSGSQSQRGIWFILPAHGASHVKYVKMDVTNFGDIFFSSLPYNTTS